MSDSQDSPISPETHYFAYGTLLGEAAMRRHAPSARRVAVAQLAHHKLVFERYSDEEPEFGGCSLIHVPGEVLTGSIYAITVAEFEAMDVMVRRSIGWFERMPVTLVTTEGEVVQASTYHIPHTLGAFGPSDDYVAEIRVGAAELGLPSWYVSRLESTIKEYQALREEG